LKLSRLVANFALKALKTKPQSWLVRFRPVLIGSIKCPQRPPQSQQRMTPLLGHLQRLSRIKLVLQHSSHHRVTSPDGGSSPRRNPIRALFESSSGISRDIRTQCGVKSLTLRLCKRIPVTQSSTFCSTSLVARQITTRAAAGRQRGVYIRKYNTATCCLPASHSTHPLKHPSWSQLRVMIHVTTI